MSAHPSWIPTCRCRSTPTTTAGGAFARAGLSHVGTHGIRHRAATDIANSGIPLKICMVLTAHKTVTMFMRYVHTEDDPIRAAAETVALRRQILIGGSPAVTTPAPIQESI